MFNVEGTPKDSTNTEQPTPYKNLSGKRKRDSSSSQDEGRQAKKRLLSGPLHAKKVVLVGNVGHGKSALIEKLTGKTDGKSSRSSELYTKDTGSFEVPDKSLVIVDTPGANARDDAIRHNQSIAKAMNNEPISKILLVVKADHRIDNVVDNVQQYVERIKNLKDLICVVVTHMDRVDWKENICAERIAEYHSIKDVLFTQLNDDGPLLLKNILSVCRNTPVNDQLWKKS